MVSSITPSYVLLLVTLYVDASIFPATAPPCPCTNRSWCKPVSGPPVRPSGEIYGFVNDPNSDPRSLNWTHITTVAWAPNSQYMCMAHQHGARAVMASPPFDLDKLMNDEALTAWATDALITMESRHMDGIVFDYETPENQGSRRSLTYAALVSETTKVFHEANPSYQISVAVPWSPDNIDGRNYPWLRLAAGSDLLYVMDYDTRSQIFSDCIASANAPLAGMKQGMSQWLESGIPPAKLVLGVPWYGYRYPCLLGAPLDARYCPIEQVPFRGVDCSDAAGTEVDFAKIMAVMRSLNASKGGGLRRDVYMDAPFFNSGGWGDTGALVQYWFDDALAMKTKLSWARDQKLGGVGPYGFNMLDPVNGAMDAQEMWSSLDHFLV